MNLSEARAARAARADLALDLWADQRLDLVGISLAVKDVSPSDRNKLKGIVKRLAGKTNPFTTCMNDLRKNKPEWSEERRKKTCGTLKALTGRGNSGSTKASLALSEPGECVLIDDGIAKLLELADLSKLEESK